MLKRYGIGWKVGLVCVRVWVFNMEELNELTKRLFQEGYDKEHYPDYVKPFNQYYGGFEYTLEAQNIVDRIVAQAGRECKNKAIKKLLESIEE